MALSENYFGGKSTATIAFFSFFFNFIYYIISSKAEVQPSFLPTSKWPVSQKSITSYTSKKPLRKANWWRGVGQGSFKSEMRRRTASAICGFPSSPATSSNYRQFPYSMRHRRQTQPGTNYGNRGAAASRNWNFEKLSGRRVDAARERSSRHE